MSTQKLVGMYVVHCPGQRFELFGRIVEAVEPGCVLVRVLDPGSRADIEEMGGFRRLFRIDQFIDPAWTFFRDRDFAAAASKAAKQISDSTNLVELGGTGTVKR